MCKIAVCFKRHMNKDEFEACWRSNDDGMGYGFLKDGKLNAKKGFMIEDAAWGEYRMIPIPHVVHFRTSTAGGIAEELTHPFLCTFESPVFKEIVTEDPILFHNGCIRNWENLARCFWTLGKGGMGNYSDSRLLATLIGDMDFLSMRRTLRMALDWDKFVLMKPGKICMIGDFEKYRDIYYSGTAPTKPFQVCYSYGNRVEGTAFGD